MMNSKTTSGAYRGVSYFLAVEDHGGKFKAKSTILFSTHQAIVDWGSHPVAMFFERGATQKGANHFFYRDPTFPAKCATEGTIDSVCDLIDLRNRLIETDYQCAVFGDIAKIDLLNKHIEEAELMQQKIRPDTAPTDDQLIQMKEQVEKLVGIFTATGIASISGNSRQTVNNWIARGRISAQAAHEVCKLDEVSAHGFTRESMRPDVKFWYIQ